MKRKILLVLMVVVAGGSFGVAAAPRTLAECGDDSDLAARLLQLAPMCALLGEPFLIASCVAVVVPGITLLELLQVFDTKDCAGAISQGSVSDGTRYYAVWDRESAAEAVRDATANCSKAGARGCREVIRFRFAAAGFGSVDGGRTQWRQAGDIAMAKELARAACLSRHDRCRLVAAYANSN